MKPIIKNSQNGYIAEFVGKFYMPEQAYEISKRLSYMINDHIAYLEIGDVLGVIKPYNSPNSEILKFVEIFIETDLPSFNIYIDYLKTYKDDLIPVFDKFKEAYLYNATDLEHLKFYIEQKINKEFHNLISIYIDTNSGRSPLVAMSSTLPPKIIMELILFGKLKECNNKNIGICNDYNMSGVVRGYQI